MDNPLLGQEPLPRFDAIRPEHVEPAVRELLAREPRAHRGAAQAEPHPTFATVVEPLEELQHRSARTWSPVSHLNAVLNSEALRAATTPVCRCCPPTRPIWRRASRCTAPTAPSPSARARRSTPCSAR